ncbi:hypothetical protein [Sunxiuqinia sp. sy24]|uniref:hypothetical protein n=1 Tax=Sunxiuqinia sp. sy24 TaxID=3461495 RepID=UPI00404561C1
MKINKLYFAFLVLLTATMVACSEYEDTVEPSPVVAAGNPAVRFYSDNSTLFEFESTDEFSFNLTVVRDNKETAIEVPISEIADTANIFNVPETLAFPAGVDTVSLTITLDDNTPLGKTCGLEIQFDEQFTNPYKVEYPYFKLETFIQPPCAENEVILNITFDGYASECTWEILDADQEVIESGGPWADGTVSATSKHCLEDGTYSFKIYDEYGDGLTYPETGAASLVFDGNEIVHVDGDFGASKSVSFTLGN